MIEWILILVGVIAIFVVSKFIHFNHLKAKVLLITAIVIILFVAATFAAVVHNNPTDWKSPSSIFSIVKVYFMWVGQAFDNMRTLTANAIRMDWMPNNVTFSK